MSCCRTLMVITICAIGVFIFATSPLLADAPKVINYQGRLTTASGDPVPNANYSIIFTIYDALGVPLWTSGPQTVRVTDGLFTYLLGSTVAFPEGLFVGTGEVTRYLGVKVGSDAEIVPRTQLSSAPFAVVAGSVSGDVETGEGTLELKKSTGSTGISFELELDPTSRAYQAAAFLMFDPQPEPPGKMFEMRTSAAQGPEIYFFDPQPEPPGVMMHLQANPADGGNIIMYSAHRGKAPGGPVLQLSGNTTRGGSLVMFDPQPEPPGVLFNLDATSASGPSMSFFNQAGQVMGVEPSPFIPGFSMKLYNPQTETPSVLLDMATVFGSTNSATLAMHASSLGGPNSQLVSLSSAMGAGELLLGPGTALKATGPVVRCYSSTTESRIEIVGPGGGPTVTPPISLYSNMLTARVGIGTDAPSQALHVVGNICYTGTIGACSDGAFKKDIEPIENALIKVDRLSGVRYSWRTNEFPDYRFSNERQVGVVAQQVMDVLPEAVTCQPDGFYTVDYSRLTPLLIEAIKELKLQNEKLAARLEALERAK